MLPTAKAVCYANAYKKEDVFAGPRYIWKYHFVFFHAERITQELQQTAPPTIYRSGQIGQISLTWGQISLVCKQTSPACEQIGLICEQISPIYAQISLVWEQISLICKQTNLICEQLLLICGQMNHICENILPFLAFSTFQCFHSMLSVSNLTKYLSAFEANNGIISFVIEYLDNTYIHHILICQFRYLQYHNI